MFTTDLIFNLVLLCDILHGVSIGASVEVKGQLHVKLMSFHIPMASRD